MVEIRATIAGVPGTFDLLGSLQELERMIDEAVRDSGRDPHLAIITLHLDNQLDAPKQHFARLEASVIAVNVAEDLKWLVGRRDTDDIQA